MKTRLLAGMAVIALGITFSACQKKVAAARPSTPEPAASTTPSAAVSTPYTPARSSEVSSAPQSNMPDAATRARIQDLLNRIQDAYFDYDKHNLRPDAEVNLQADAKTLSDIIRQYPEFKLTVEGHCDERGSDEYNLALGDARAKQASQYLATLGLPGGQLRTVSYGKEKPACTEHDEACWQKNRRAHLAQGE
jgi:peptidoglycan-associated lipoprotein